MSILKDLRKETGLTQKQLAEKAGTVTAQIYKLEQGLRKVSLRWAKRLAPHLNIKPTDLLFSKEELAQMASPSTSKAIPLLYIKGMVESGTWRTSVRLPKEEWQPFAIPLPKQFQQTAYGLKVRGTNKWFPENTILVCANEHETTHPPQKGNKVIINKMEKGKFELTVQEFPYSIKNEKKEKIIAIIIGSYRPEV